MVKAEKESTFSLKTHIQYLCHLALFVRVMNSSEPKTAIYISQVTSRKKLCACSKCWNCVNTLLDQHQWMHFITISFFSVLHFASWPFISLFYSGISRDLEMCVCVYFFFRLLSSAMRTELFIRWVFRLCWSIVIGQYTCLTCDTKSTCDLLRISWRSRVLKAYHFQVSLYFPCIVHLPFGKCYDLGLNSSASPIIYCVLGLLLILFFFFSLFSSTRYGFPVKASFLYGSLRVVSNASLFLVSSSSCEDWKCCRKCVSQSTELYCIEQWTMST